MLDDAARERRRELELRAYAPDGGLTDAEAAELQALTDRSAARRRELQRRAYAPGGGLTDAEAAELRQLDAQGAARAETVVAPAPAFASSAAARRPDADERLDADERPVAKERAVAEENPDAEGNHDVDGAPTPDTPSGESHAGTPTTRRRRWLAPLAALVALLLGFGAGWLAFGRDDEPAMTAEQHDTWVELEASNEYDPGSLSFVGSQYGVDAWSGTRDDGALACFTLTAREARSQTPACVQSDSERQPYALQASISVEDGEGRGLVWATLAEHTTGEPVVIMQRQSSEATWDWRTQYTETELPIAEFLDDSGFSGDSLQLIGYDGETPIWMHQYDRACLLVATAEEVLGEACGDLDTAKPLELAMPGVVYSVRMTDMRGPMLTVIHTPDATAIDDKTGEIVE